MANMIEEIGRTSPLNEELIADAKRRYDEAQAERQRIYEAVARMERMRRNRPRGRWRRLLRHLGIA